jgi:hypothetical protein
MKTFQNARLHIADHLVTSVDYIICSAFYHNISNFLWARVSNYTTSYVTDLVSDAIHGPVSDSTAAADTSVFISTRRFISKYEA